VNGALIENTSQSLGFLRQPLAAGGDAPLATVCQNFRPLARLAPQALLKRAASGPEMCPVSVHGVQLDVVARNHVRPTMLCYISLPW